MIITLANRRVVSDMVNEPIFEQAFKQVYADVVEETKVNCFDRRIPHLWKIFIFGVGVKGTLSKRS